MVSQGRQTPGPDPCLAYWDLMQHSCMCGGPAALNGVWEQGVVTQLKSEDDDDSADDDNDNTDDISTKGFPK